ALVTANALGVVILRAIQRNQQLIVEYPISRQMALCPQAGFDAIEQWKNRFGWHLIKQIADVVVGGNPSHAKYTLGIALAAGLRHARLMGQKRRALCPEYRECRPR